jgi:nicotinamidase-related amidase
MVDAVLVVDMINEFVNGRFGSRRAQAIVPAVVSLCNRAREAGVPVFYVRDAHRQSDPELRVWGRHAMAGTRASEIVVELEPQAGDFVFQKNQYSGFLNTGLEKALRKVHADTIYFAGISTDICVQHNVADALYRGYRTVVVEDCVESISARAKATALKYMKSIYGSKIIQLNKVKF